MYNNVVSTRTFLIFDRLESQCVCRSVNFRASLYNIDMYLSILRVLISYDL